MSVLRGKLSALNKEFDQLKLTHSEQMSAKIVVLKELEDVKKDREREIALREKL